MAAVLIGPRCNREVPWIAFWRMCAVLSVMLRGTSHARAATAMRSNSRTLRAARYMATNRGRGPAHSVEALVSKARKRKMPVVILTNLGAPSPGILRSVGTFQRFEPGCSTPPLSCRLRHTQRAHNEPPQSRW